MEKLTQIEIDNLADIIWWIKGYIAGAKDNFEQCPFDLNHVESLRKARLNCMELNKNQSNTPIHATEDSEATHEL